MKNNLEKRIREFLKKMDSEASFERYIKGLPAEALETLLEELERVNVARILLHRKILGEYRKGTVPVTLKEVGPVKGEKISPPMKEEGISSLERGEWASAVLAGGAGTRFFSELGEGSIRSKGLFPITPLGKHSFLEFFAGEILSTGIKHGKLPLWLLMTSSLTHAEIEEWVRKEKLHGLPREGIIIFQQEEHPRLDEDGYLIVNRDGRLFWTGDGHGGIFRAILKKREGGSVIERLRREGIKYLVIHNVDNILSRPLEPGRLGFHILGKYLFTMSCVKREDPSEKIGIAVYNRERRRCEVIEYSVCSPEIMEAKEEGELLFNAGHINTNLISLEAIVEEVPPTLYTGKPVKVGEKTVMSSSLEMLNQNILHLLPPERTGVCLVEREFFFSPTKSVKGKDSVEDTRKNLSRFFASLLRQVGAEVEDEATVEIHPCSGTMKEELEEAGMGNNWKLGRGSALYICARFSPSEKPPFGKRLVLEEGASLFIKTEKPFGDVKYNPFSREIKACTEKAGRVRIGDGVKVLKGVSVRIELDGNGVIDVEDHFVFKKSMEIRVSAGERRVLKAE